MKFGKITSKNVSESALSIGGALGGSALSGGLMTLVPEEQLLIARGGATALGVLGMASVSKDKTTAGTLVKFACAGMAIRQGIELIRDFASKEIEVTPEMEKGQRFVAGMAGLACPCEADYQPAMPALNASPVMNFEDLQRPDASLLDTATSTSETSSLFD